MAQLGHLTGGQCNFFRTIAACFTKKYYLCIVITLKYVFVMARPIKETPILYGEEARKFETRMMNPEPVSREWLESMKRDYEFMRSRCVNCSF